jgi:hypothetical protein
MNIQYQFNNKLKQVRIDTIHLVAKLNRVQVNTIESLINFYNDDLGYYKKYSEKDLFIGLFATNEQAKQHYTIKLIIQHSQLHNSLISQLLRIASFKIHRIDIAFDFTIPIRRTLTYKKGRAKSKWKDKQNNYNDNYYINSFKSNAFSLIYDKKAELAQEDIHIDDDYLTRFEMRIKPVLSKQTNVLYDNLYSLLAVYIDKFIFIPDIKHLPITADERRILKRYGTSKKKQFPIGVSAYQKNKLVKVIKDCRYNFLDTYIKHESNLFEWLDSTYIHTVNENIEASKAYILNLNILKEAI